MFGVTMFRPTMFGVTIFWIETSLSELAPFINPYIHPCSFTNVSSQLKLKIFFIFFWKISKCQIFPDIVFFRVSFAPTTILKCFFPWTKKMTSLRRARALKFLGGAKFRIRSTSQAPASAYVRHQLLTASVYSLSLGAPGTENFKK